MINLSQALTIHQNNTDNRSFDDKIRERVKTQDQNNLSKLLMHNWSSSMSRKNIRKINWVKPSVLSKSSNPFTRIDKINFVTESSAWKVRKAPTVSKSRSKKRKEQLQNKTWILDYSVLSDGTGSASRRYNSRSKIQHPRSKKRNEESKFILNTQNSESTT